MEGGLDEAEELRLIRRVKATGDKAASDRLVESHKALILGCVKRLGLSKDSLDNIKDDLYNEGVLGLISAIANFDETKGRRLSAIAKFHVRAHMTDFVLANMSAVRPVNSRGQRAAFYHVRRLRGTEVTDEESRKIAETIGVEVADVRFVAGRLSGADVSLDGFVGGGDSQGMSLSEVIADEAPHQEELLIEKDEKESWARKMRTALALLPERERDILTGRRLTDPPVSIETIANRYAISKGRVTQIEQQAFGRLKALIERDGAERRQLPEPSLVPARVFHRRVIR